MSHYDYVTGLHIASKDHPFVALIQAAMRKADSQNIAKLALAFPEIWKELNARYTAPGGYLPGELETGEKE